MPLPLSSRTGLAAGSGLFSLGGGAGAASWRLGAPLALSSGHVDSFFRFCPVGLGGLHMFMGYGVGYDMTPADFCLVGSSNEISVPSRR